jgi:galactose-1-phosphate uridylyltransferase
MLKKERTNRKPKYRVYFDYHGYCIYCEAMIEKDTDIYPEKCEFIVPNPKYESFEHITHIPTKTVVNKLLNFNGFRCLDMSEGIRWKHKEDAEKAKEYLESLQFAIELLGIKEL